MSKNILIVDDDRDNVRKREGQALLFHNLNLCLII